MPLYEYQCADCKKIHEIMQKFSDAPIQDCPECNGPVTKLMSLSSFSLKGAGWYTTDYKRAAPETKQDGKQDIKQEAKDSTPAGASTEVKTPPSTSAAPVALEATASPAKPAAAAPSAS